MFFVNNYVKCIVNKSTDNNPGGDLSLGGGEPGATSCKEILEADGSVTVQQGAFGGIGLNIGILHDGGRIARGENGLGLAQGGATVGSGRVDEGRNRRLQLVDRPIP